jgi:hypothetical protein
MDEQVVALEDYFTVRNEVTGDIDYLLFPGDVENYANPGNVINCQCDYEILSNSPNYDNYQDTVHMIDDTAQIHSRLGTTSFNVTEYPNRNLIIGQHQGRPSFISNNKILEAYDNLPKTLQDNIEKIYVFDKELYNINGKYILGQASVDNNLINLYKSPRSIGVYKDHVIPHESGHLIYNRIDEVAYKNAIRQDEILNSIRGKSPYILSVMPNLKG